MFKKWLGDTLHTHGFGGNEYPHQQLFNLLAVINYSGWILLEESTDPADKIAALNEKRIQFNELLAKTIKG